MSSMSSNACRLRKYLRKKRRARDPKEIRPFGPAVLALPFQGLWWPHSALERRGLETESALDRLPFHDTPKPVDRLTALAILPGPTQRAGVNPPLGLVDHGPMLSAYPFHQMRLRPVRAPAERDTAPNPMIG